MKKTILVGFLILIILVNGCGQNQITGNVVKETETITKFVCSEGSTVDNQEDCPKVEEKVIEKIITIEKIKIKCEDEILVEEGKGCPKIIKPVVVEETPTITLNELKEIVQNVVSSNFQFKGVNSVSKNGDDIYVEVKYYNIDRDGITHASYDFVKEFVNYIDDYKGMNLHLTLQAEYGYGSATSKSSALILNQVKNLELGMKDWARTSRISYEGDLVKL